VVAMSCAGSRYDTQDDWHCGTRLGRVQLGAVSTGMDEVYVTGYWLHESVLVVTEVAVGES